MRRESGCGPFANAPQLLDFAATHDRNPVARVEAIDVIRLGLGVSRRHFGALLGVSDSYGAGEARAILHRTTDRPSEHLGVITMDTEKRFIPTPDLDGM